MKYINIEDQFPVMNEIIIYEGNLGGIEGRYMGQDFCQLPNGDVDQFDKWRPKRPGFVTMKVTHVDGITNIEALGKVINGEFVGEYKYQGMTYGATIPIQFTTQNTDH